MKVNSNGELGLKWSEITGSDEVTVYRKEIYNPVAAIDGVIIQKKVCLQVPLELIWSK